MTGPRRLLIAGLVVILVLLELNALLGTVLIAPRFAVDLEIPLRAVERWSAGGTPYEAAAFLSPPGPTQPFLYPPYTLPFFAALGTIARQVLAPIVVGSLLAISIWTIRRLGIPWRWSPLVLAWPPFAEAIYGANVQVILFALFAAIFYVGSATERLAPRAIHDPHESDLVTGGGSAVIAAIKVSQLFPWLYVLRVRPRAAILGAAIIALAALATLPLTGISMWFDWLDQVRRATDPTWDLGGFAATRYLPPILSPVVVIVCAACCWLVPRRNAGAWVGVISTIGSASLHIFGLLFLIPAMLLIRIEAALLAAILIATYSYEGAWAGIGVTTVALWLAHRRPEGLGVDDHRASARLPASSIPGT